MQPAKLDGWTLAQGPALSVIPHAQNAQPHRITALHALLTYLTTTIIPVTLSVKMDSGVMDRLARNAQILATPV